MVAGSSIANINRFSFTYWVAATNAVSESLPTSGNSTNDLYSNVPAILLNYKDYINKMSEKVFWVILYYCIAISSFLMGVTLLACSYKHIVEPYCLNWFYKLFVNICGCRCLCKLTFPFWLCPCLYKIRDVEANWTKIKR